MGGGVTLLEGVVWPAVTGAVGEKFKIFSTPLTRGVSLSSLVGVVRDRTPKLGNVEK